MDLGDEAGDVIRSLLSGSQGSRGSKVDPRDFQNVLIIDVFQQENAKLLNDVIKNKAFPVTGVNLVDSVRLVTVSYHFVFCCDAVSYIYTVYVCVRVYFYLVYSHHLIPSLGLDKLHNFKPFA